MIDFKAQDPIRRILDLTNNQGVDSAIEALGGAATFEACVKATRRGGTISNVGYHGAGDFVGIPRLAWGVGMSDKTIRTALCPGGRERVNRLMRLIQSGKVHPLPMTTHRFEFCKVDRAFDLADEGGRHCQVPHYVLTRGAADSVARFLCGNPLFDHESNVSRFGEMKGEFRWRLLCGRRDGRRCNLERLAAVKRD